MSYENQIITMCFEGYTEYERLGGEVLMQAYIISSEFFISVIWLDDIVVKNPNTSSIETVSILAQWSWKCFSVVSLQPHHTKDGKILYKTQLNLLEKDISTWPETSFILEISSIWKFDILLLKSRRIDTFELHQWFL